MREGRCAITGLAVPALLRASHIKPWADCDDDKEQLDVFNGFLLSASLDAAFDSGVISVADDGEAASTHAEDDRSPAYLRQTESGTLVPPAFVRALLYTLRGRAA